MGATVPERLRLSIGGLLVDFERNTVSGPSGESRLEPRLAAVLFALVSQPGAVVSRETLIDTIWDGAYGADQSLTNAVSQLRKTLNHCEQGQGKRIVTVPKRGYQFIGQATPAPYIDVIDVVSAEPETDLSAESTGHQTILVMLDKHRMVLMVLGAVFFGLIMIAAFKTNRHSPSTPSESTSASSIDRFHIALFETSDNIATEELEQSRQLDAFARVVHDELERTFTLHQLTTVSSGEDAAEFHIVGRIRRDDDAMKAMVDVDHRPTGVKLWSFSLEGLEAASPAYFADQIAFKLADIMSCSLNERRRFGGELSIEVLALLTRYCELAKGSGKDFSHLPELTRKLMALLPNHGEAHSINAATAAFHTYSQRNPTKLDLQELPKIAYESAEIALAANPKNGRALWALAIVKDNEVGVAKRIDYLRQALKDDPTFYYSRNHLAHFLLSVGRVEDALGYYRLFIEDFPLDRQATIHYPALLAKNGRLDAGRQYVEPWLKRFPDKVILQWRWFLVEFWYGDTDRAASLAELLGFNADAMICVNTVLDARRLNETLTVDDLNKNCENHWLVDPIIYFARFGHVDEVFELINDNWQKYAEPNNVWARRNLFGEGLMAPVHADPRFMVFAHKIGLVEYWQGMDMWPDFCNRDDLVYDCKKEVMKLQ